ncbi:MAG: LysE family translocator [Pseudomonadota bacterium]
MSLSAFLVAAVLLAITPGPGIAYVVARTVAGGRVEGFASAIGTSLGGLVHVFAAAVGVSVILAQSAVAFSVVKYLGAAYLVFLGLRLLFAGQRVSASATPAARGALRALAEGVLVEVFNVKTALFFLAFLPQFVTPDGAVAAQLVALGCICVALNTGVDVFAVLSADRLVRSAPGRAVRARVLNAVSGSTLVGLGVYLALTERVDAS